MATRSLLLASASPRRRELLAQIGIDCRVGPVAIDETPAPGESATALVERLARAKATAAVPAAGAAVVLAADTCVEVDGELLGKPVDAAAADAMLARLSGRSHHVHSGIAVAADGATAASVVTTRVTFRAITPAERAAYWASGEPADKAGAYAVQGLGAIFVRSLEGSYSNVVGLPLFETAARLAAVGIDPLAPGADAEAE